MYTISDAVEIGKAQDLILDSSKEPSSVDDFNPQTQVKKHLTSNAGAHRA